MIFHLEVSSDRNAHRSEFEQFPTKQVNADQMLKMMRNYLERERPLPQRKYRHPEPKEMHQTTFSIVAFSTALCNLPG
jgi:hypothetical protein